MDIPFIDLTAAYQASARQTEAAIKRVLYSGSYILGDEVSSFEQEFAAFCHAGECIGVASGTDALLLALKGYGIGPGDEVISVAHTAVATVAAIELSGATPVLVDVEPESCTLDPGCLPAALSERTRAIIPVHIYGHPADMSSILGFAKEHGLIVIEDCAQAHGAQCDGRPVGGIGDASAFSFYPTKNLGAVGDGGAVVTNDGVLAERVRSLRQYGWRTRYISEEPGYNSRLDELQAAILRVRLSYLAETNRSRRQLAAIYAQHLARQPLATPGEAQYAAHVYHLYVVQSSRRDALRRDLAGQGIACAVHYPVPVHLQPAYAHLGYGVGSLPVTERLAREVLSLPLYAYMPQEHVLAVVAGIRLSEEGPAEGSAPSDHAL